MSNIGEASMEMRYMKCPFCKENIEIEKEMDSFFCNFCGKKIRLKDHPEEAGTSGFNKKTPGGSKRDEPRIMMETDDGRVLHIPESRLENFNPHAGFDTPEMRKIQESLNKAAEEYLKKNCVEYSFYVEKELADEFNEALMDSRDDCTLVFTRAMRAYIKAYKAEMEELNR